MYPLPLLRTHPPTKYMSCQNQIWFEQLTDRFLCVAHVATLDLALEPIIVALATAVDEALTEARLLVVVPSLEMRLAWPGVHRHRTDVYNGTTHPIVIVTQPRTLRPPNYHCHKLSDWSISIKISINFQVIIVTKSPIGSSLTKI